MIETLKSIYRRYLRRYWLARIARNAFVRTHTTLTPLWMVCSRRSLGRAKKYRLKVWQPTHSLPSITVTLFHGAENVSLPGPVVWREDALASLWEPEFRHSYVWPEIQLLEINDAIVAGASDFLFVRGLALAHPLYEPRNHTTAEELHQHGVLSVSRQRYFRVNSVNLPLHLPAAISMVGSCAANYAHWLTEMLPRLLLADQLPRCRGLPLLVDAGLHPNLMASIAALAPTHTELIPVKPGQTAHVGRLAHLFAPSYVPFDYRHRLFGSRPKIERRTDSVRYSPFALRLLKEKVEALVPGTTKHGRKLYLRRRTGARVVVNHNEIEATLAAEGFEVIEPDSLSFIDQVRLFREAAVVVGQTGAGLMNLLFAPVACRAIVLIVRSPHSNYLYYSSLAHIAGLTLCYVHGEPADRTAWHPAHSDFIVRPEEVIAAVRGWCEGR